MAAKYPQRRIGGEAVSALGLGCMGMSFGYTTGGGYNDEAAALAVLTRAADRGITFWDTSDIYGPFTNEALLGRWFAATGRRDEIFLATKFGYTLGADGRLAVDGRPAHVRAACAASLARLQTDRIDLYYQHRADAATPIEHTVAAMAALRREGKVRHLGLSECSARTLRRAAAVHPIAAVQLEYSPFALEIEAPATGLLAAARELGVAVVAYSPLGRGFLSGAIRSRADLDPTDSRANHPRFNDENFAGNLALVDTLAAIAREKECTPSQLVLAWVLAQGEDFIPIPGTKRVEYLEENAGAVDVKLSAEDEQRIRQAIESVGGTKGARYPPAMLAHCFGDTPEL